MNTHKAWVLVAAMSLVVWAAGGAEAARVDLTVFENASAVSTAGLDLWVDVLDVGGSQVDFVFHNDSTISAIVTQIYFESTFSGLLTNGALQGATAGVAFVVGADPGSPPGGTNISWAGELASFGRANAGGVSNGVNNPPPIETLTIRFDYDGATTLADVLDVLGDASGRIAQHVQSVGTSSASISTVTSGIVPLPTAAWSAMVLIAAIGLVRTVRHHHGATRGRY